MLPIEKTLEEILILLRNFLRTNKDILFRPKKMINDLERGVGVPLNPKTYLLLCITISYSVSRTNTDTLVNLGDAVNSSILRDLTDLTILLISTIIAVELCIAPFNVNRRRKVYLAFLAYLILGFGTILPVVIWPMTMFGQNIVMGISALILLLVLVVTYIVRIINAVHVTYLNNLKLRSQIQTFIFLVAGLVVAQTYIYGTVYRAVPDIAVTAPHGPNVPFSYHYGDSATYTVSLDLKIDNRSNSKIVLPANDSIFVVTQNSWNYKFSRFTTSEQYLQIEFDSASKKNGYYFKRVPGNDKSLSVKPNDYELIKYECRMKSTIADTLVIKKLTRADDAFVQNLTEEPYTVDWVVNFRFYGRQQMYYYAIPIQLTSSQP